MSSSFPFPSSFLPSSEPPILPALLIRFLYTSNRQLLGVREVRWSSSSRSDPSESAQQVSGRLSRSFRSPSSLDAVVSTHPSLLLFEDLTNSLPLSYRSTVKKSSVKSQVSSSQTERTQKPTLSSATPSSTESSFTTLIQIQGR